MFIKTNRKFISVLLIAVAFVFATAFFTVFDTSLDTPVVALAEEGSEEGVTELMGAGTSENAPFFIRNRDEFVFFAEQVNAGGSKNGVAYDSAYYKLDGDIDLEGATVVPVGTSARPFNGKFDGDGKILKNYSLTATSNGAGVFGYIGANGEIKDLGIFGAQIDGGSYMEIGGIVGNNLGTIESSFFNGAVSGFSYVGGIAGVNGGKLRYVFSSGKVQSSSVSAYNGGLVGKNSDVIAYSYSIAEVVSQNSSANNVGGVIGGRTGSTATPSFAYFDNSFASYQGEVKAIGGGSDDSYDSAATEISGTVNNVKGIDDDELNNSDVYDLFGAVVASQRKWEKKFTVSDHTAYSGLSLYAFRDYSDQILMETVVTVRKFDVDVYSEYARGSEANPFTIKTEEQFGNLAIAVNKYDMSYLDKYFALGADITFKTEAEPVGNVTDNKAFRGTFDGKFHTLSGYKNTVTSREDAYVGVFGYIRDGAVIKNLTLSSDCTVIGTEYAGGLVGYCENGKIANVESRASVRALGNSGGIIGCIKGGEYSDILSVATFIQLGSSTNLYGIVGGYTESKASTVSNIWFFAPMTLTGGAENPYVQPGEFGNTLCYSPQDGDIVAAKSAEGNMSFTCRAIGTGYSVEYRYKDESVLHKASNDYSPARDAKITGTVYARFVKELDFKTSNADYSTIPDKSSFATTYYVGQKITFPVVIRDGAYIKSIVGLDGSDNPVELSAESTYAYETDRSAVVLTTSMTATLRTLSVEIEFINWDTTLFPTSRTYDGNPVEFPVRELVCPAGFGVSVIYNGGRAPSAANLTSRDKYTLVIVYSYIYSPRPGVETSVRMGSRQADFRIERKNLSVPVDRVVDILSHEKEWDNSFDAVPATVDQTGIVGKVGSDDVVVHAMMAFDTADITDTANVTYTFTLSGADSSNYNAPTSVTGMGTITKRNVTISFVNGYSGVYSGSGNPSLNGNPFDYEGLIGSMAIVPEFEFIHKDAKALGSVGEYILKVDISATHSPEADRYYNLNFKNALYYESATEDYYYVLYTVNPKAVEVVYSGIKDAEGKDYVYNGNARTVTASFTDVGGASVALNINGAATATMLNAGSYDLSITDFTDENYTLIGDTVTARISKAEQSALIIDCLSKVEFGNTVTVLVTGGNTDGDVDYSLASGYEDYGTFTDNVLSFAKAGTLTIEVVKGGTTNYNAVTATKVITVTKAQITVAVKDAEVVYGSTPTFVLLYDDSETIPSGVTGIVVLVDGEPYSAEEAYDVDTYELTVDLANAVSDGYTFTAGAPGELKVNKLAVSVQANNASSAYGAEIAELTYTVTPEGTAISGNLGTDAGTAVGDYSVTIGTLVESNPNYDITFTGAVYSVVPAKLTVKVVSQSKTYGTADPAPSYTVEGLQYGDTAESIGLDVNLSRLAGENAYIGGSTAGYAIYDYVNRGITHTSTDYEPVVTFVKGGLKITRALPECKTIANVKHTPGTSLFDVEVPEAEFIGVDDDTLEGTFAWKDNVTLFFKDSTTVICKAVFTPTDPNYREAEVDVVIGVDPIRVSVSFSGSRSTVYDGMSHKNDIKYTFRNVLEGDDPGVQIDYVGDFVNTGKHSLKLKITNNNYVLGNNATFELEIKKAELTVAIEDIEIMEGATPTVEFYYIGFCTGDGADDFTVAPMVDLPTAAGTYKVTPYGGSLKNYTLVYLESTVKILAKTVESSDEEDGSLAAEFEGAFDAATSVTVKDGDTSRISTLFGEAKNAYTSLSDKAIYKYYTVKFTVGESEITPEGDVYIKFALPEDAGNTEELAFLLVSRTGELVYAKDVVIDGEYVKLNITGASGVVIARTSVTDNTTYILIGVIAAAVVIVIVLIAVGVKKKKEKRYIKYKD